MNLTLQFPPGVGAGKEEEYVFNRELGRDVYLHGGEHVDRETGLIDLTQVYGNSEAELRTKPRANPSPLQLSVAAVVTEALGEDWIFRQVRDAYGDNPRFQDKYSDLRKNPLGIEGVSYNISILYQRNKSLDDALATQKTQKMLYSEDEATFEFYTEPFDLNALISGIKGRIDALVEPRYVSENITTLWQRWHQNRIGVVDPRVISVDIFFEDREMRYEFLRGDIKDKRVELKKQKEALAELKKILGKKK